MCKCVNLYSYFNFVFLKFATAKLSDPSEQTQPDSFNRHSDRDGIDGICCGGYWLGQASLKLATATTTKMSILRPPQGWTGSYKNPLIFHESAPVLSQHNSQTYFVPFYYQINFIFMKRVDLENFMIMNYDMEYF